MKRDEGDIKTVLWHIFHSFFSAVFLLFCIVRALSDSFSLFSPLTLPATAFQLNITGAVIWINPFVGILTIIALWPVSILFLHLKVALRTLKIVPKYAMYQVRRRIRMYEHKPLFTHTELYMAISITHISNYTVQFLQKLRWDCWVP